MTFKLYKFNSNGEIIGAHIWKNFPLVEDSIHVPFTNDCYVIIESDKIVPDKFVVTSPTQKPMIVFIQPLGEEVDVNLSKKIAEVNEVFISGDNIKKEIIKKINSDKSYKVLTATNNIVSYFIEKIMEDRR